MQVLSYSTNLFMLAITEINTNMYLYAVNKHACPTNVTLQSVYEIQSSDLFTITIP